MYEEKKKSAERKQTKTKLPSECQQETNEKKIKSSQASKREQNRFCKKRLLSQKKSKNQN